MDLRFNTSLAEGYKSASQIARVLPEEAMEAVTILLQANLCIQLFNELTLSANPLDKRFCCLNPEQVVSNWKEEYHLAEGNVDVTAINPEYTDKKAICCLQNAMRPERNVARSAP